MKKPQSQTTPVVRKLALTILALTATSFSTVSHAKPTGNSVTDQPRATAIGEFGLE